MKKKIETTLCEDLENICKKHKINPLTAGFFGENSDGKMLGIMPLTTPFEMKDYIGVIENCARNLQSCREKLFKMIDKMSGRIIP